MTFKCDLYLTTMAGNRALQASGFRTLWNPGISPVAAMVSAASPSPCASGRFFAVLLCGPSSSSPTALGGCVTDKIVANKLLALCVWNACQCQSGAGAPLAGSTNQKGRINAHGWVNVKVMFSRTHCCVLRSTFFRHRRVFRHPHAVAEQTP